MSNAGSSRIPKISSVILDGSFVGPTGPSGPTGNPGSYSTGPIGLCGQYILNIYGISSDTVRVQFAPGIAIWSDISDVDGPTGDSNSIGSFFIGFTGETTGNFYPVISGDGITLFFKSIEIIGEATAAYSSTDLIITGKTFTYAGSLIPGSLIYIGTTTGVNFYSVNSAENAIYSENYINGITYSNLEVLMYGFFEENSTSNFNYSLDLSRNDSGLTLFSNTAFYGLTFIEGYTSDLSTYATPFLKYSVNYGGVSGTGFTSSVISFGKKDIYNKTIGFEIEPLNELIGSCCYCNPIGERFCKDYVNKSYCIEKLGGNWSFSPCYLRYNNDDCYQGGACCVNNRCVSCSKAKCTVMGGVFIPGENCSSIGSCPSPCESVGCCCVNGIGYPLTSSLCAEIENSRFFNQPCSQVNCCTQGDVGACCIRKVCYDFMTAYECGLSGGVFQGPGTACTSQFLNCCTDPTIRQTPLMGAVSQPLIANSNVDSFPDGPPIPFDDPRWTTEPPFYPDGMPNPNWPGWTSDTWPTDFDPDAVSPFMFPRWFTKPGEYFELPGYSSPIEIPTETPTDRGIPPAYILPDGQELYWDGQRWWLRDPNKKPDQWRFNPPNSLDENETTPYRWIPYIPGYGVPIRRRQDGRWHRSIPNWWWPNPPAYRDINDQYIPILPPFKRGYPNNRRFVPAMPGGRDFEQQYPDFERGPYFNQAL